MDVCWIIWVGGVVKVREKNGFGFIILDCLVLGLLVIVGLGFEVRCGVLV